MEFAPDKFPIGIFIGEEMKNFSQQEVQLQKGDVIAVARVAGVMAAKRTPEIVPLCHSVNLHDVGVEFVLDDTLPGIRVQTSARSSGKTGVEMEALTAAVAALLTIYDMAKAIDREMTIVEVMLLEKSGGRSGDWVRGVE